MSTSQKTPKQTSSSKTTNVKAVLEVLRDVGKMGEAVPYLEGAAGILKTIIEMKEEFTASKEAWAKTMEGVEDIRKIITDSVQEANKSSLPPPDHLKDAMAVLEKCVLGIAEASDKINSMKGVKRFVRRREFKADAEACAADVGRALELFQTKLQIKLATQVDTIHAIVTSGAATFTQVTIPVCPSPSHLFTGRVALLESLDKIFIEKDQRVTIIGKGGSGKTQLVLRFVERQQSRFSRVFFVDATSMQSIEAAFGLIAKAHGTGSSVEDARNWFAGHAEQWLLIFDNADDPSLDLGQFIPCSSHGNIIITSRNNEISHHASLDCSILLPDLDESDAVDLLLRSAHLKDTSDHHSLAVDIVRELGCLALAVSHAGSYISQSCSLREYLPLFQSHRSVLLKEKRGQNTGGYSHTVFSAFELSYLKLSEKAKSFLHVLSFFHHSNIPLEIFSRAAEKVFDQAWSTPGCEPLKDFMSPYCNVQQGQYQLQQFLFRKTLTELQQFSIISWNRESSIISLHSMIHACAGDVVEKKETSHVIALELLNATTPTGNSIENVIMCTMLASHVDNLWNTQSVPGIFSTDIKCRETLAYIFYQAGSDRKEISLRLEIVEIQKKNLGEQDSDTLTSMSNLASTYRYLGHLQEAEQLQEKVLSLRRETLGEQHPDTWISMGHLASTYRDYGRLHEAEQLQEKVLSLQRKTLGEQDPHTWISMSHLANTYYKFGRLHEAEQLEKKVLGLRRETLGEQHADTWQSMNNLANTYYKLGRLQEAEQLQEKVLSLRRETLGEQDPHTWISMGHLANTYYKLGRLQEAEQLDEQVLSLRRETLGEQHPDTWTNMNNLSITYYKLGRLQEAEQLQKKVLSLRRETLGEQHPHTWQSIGNLANTYCELGRLHEAEQLEKKVLSLRRETLGEQHPDTWTNMNNLAIIYYKLGHLQEAEQLQKKVLSLRRETLGDQHPDTWQSMGNLANTYYRLGRLQEVEQLQEKMLSLCRETLGEQHPHTLTNMNSLANTYYVLGHLHEAEQLQEKLLSFWRETFGEQHPHTWSSMNNLANTYYKLGRLQEAEQLDKQVLNLRKETLGEQHPDTWTSMNSLANTYYVYGRLSEAEQLQEKMLSLQREALGEQHPDTWSSMNNLALIYEKLGRLQEAEQLQEKVLSLRRVTLGEQHPDTCSSMNNLALTYKKLNRIQEAEQLQKEAALLQERNPL